ncbi:hypothetical protein BCR35DRAFT_333098 [Leucosporidium creatinivorum]|uniref:F-box domain-containing protein n=1 Tax=Leucosporidium creatinivorum TaxID=106004 RepID=A0A1Y2EUP6_9BASI|nr:hypothetical protein BCR35DRAFT_333098 [Leucosporidium creatinivorum]
MSDLAPFPPPSVLFPASNNNPETSSKIPLDILIQIFDRAASVTEINERGRLAARLCLVCKLLLPYAQQMLYRAPNLEFMSIPRYDDNATLRTESNSPLLRRTLTESPHLASLVRRFDIWTEVSDVPLRRHARNCGTVEAELAKLFSLPLSIRSLELNDREAFPGARGGADLTESMAAAVCSHAAWLDQLEDLKMDCSGDKFSTLLGALPNLRRLAIPTDLVFKSRQFYPRKELAVPLISFEMNCGSSDVFWQCLYNSTQSLRLLTISAGLLDSDGLYDDLETFVNLDTVYIKVEGDRDHRIDYEDVASRLADLPSLGTLRLSYYCGVPSVLPSSVHTLQLHDPNFNVSDLVKLITGEDHGLRKLEVIRSKWTATQRLITACRDMNVELKFR